LFREIVVPNQEPYTSPAFGFALGTSASDDAYGGLMSGGSTSVTLHMRSAAWSLYQLLTIASFQSTAVLRASAEGVDSGGDGGAAGAAGVAGAGASAGAGDAATTTPAATGIVDRATAVARWRQQCESLLADFRLAAELLFTSRVATVACGPSKCVCCTLRCACVCGS
jgi:hypothetical protein